jgi:nucleoside-diphosphate-sugar epimerase
MKVFVAGATGAVGQRLVPKLIEAGHSVVGTTRSPNGAVALRAQGAEAAVVDGLDQEAMGEAVKNAEPEVIVNQMSSLASMGTNLRKFDRYFAVTNRLRVEGTANLLAAARDVGTRRFVTQSYSNWNNVREGGQVKTEADPLDPNPTSSSRQTAQAIKDQEAMLAEANGIEAVVLRYGNLYGPGTGITTGEGGTVLDAIRRRRFPIVGKGTGVWSFTHIDDAASGAVVACSEGPQGVFNIVDDEPAPVAEWMPYLCEVTGAKPPLHLPRWVGWLAGGPHLVSMMESIRGADNGKAKRELGWAPEWPTWREGFRSGLTD